MLTIEKKRDHQGLRYSGLILVLVLTSASLMSGCQVQKEQTPSDVEQEDFVNIRVHETSTGTIERHVQLSGEVFATNRVRISPDTAGLLTEVLVEPGDPVSYDQIIAWVDPSRPGMSYAKSPVKSKTTGTITQVPVISGNQVSPQVVIAEVGDLQHLEIVTKVPERYLASLRKGLLARITSRAYPEEILSAEIVEISPVVDPRSRTVHVTLKPGSNRKIRPGQSVTVNLILEKHEEVVLIPESAVTDRYTEKGVFVVRHDQALWQEASFGISQLGMIEVLEGLQAGDVIAIAGVHDLTDGISVHVLDN